MFVLEENESIFVSTFFLKALVQRYTFPKSIRAILSPGRARLCQVNFKGSFHRERDTAEVHHACSITNRCQRIQFAPVQLERHPHPQRCPLGARLQSLKRTVKDKALDYNE